MAKAFNPNKPYGTVHGGGFEGYEQNNTIYNAAYQPINFDTREVLPIDDAPAPAPAAAPADSGLPPATEGEDSEGSTDAAGTLDLDAWLAGDVKYPWTQVQSAVAAKNNGVRPKDKDEAKAILLGLN